MKTIHDRSVHVRGFHSEYDWVFIIIALFAVGWYVYKRSV